MLILLLIMNLVLVEEIRSIENIITELLECSRQLTLLGDEISHQVSSREMPALLINRVVDCRENAEMQLMYAAVVAYKDLLTLIREDKGVQNLFCSSFSDSWNKYEFAAQNKKKIVVSHVFNDIEKATRGERSEEEACLFNGLTITRAVKRCTGKKLLQSISLISSDLTDKRDLSPRAYNRIQEIMAKQDKDTELLIEYECKGIEIPVLHETLTLNNRKYRIIGVMIFIISVSRKLHPKWSNHWLSYIKLGPTWYRCNDEEITKLDNYKSVLSFIPQEGTIYNIFTLYNPES